MKPAAYSRHPRTPYQKSYPFLPCFPRCQALNSKRVSAALTTKDYGYGSARRDVRTFFFISTCGTCGIEDIDEKDSVACLHDAPLDLIH